MVVGLSENPIPEIPLAWPTKHNSNNTVLSGSVIPARALSNQDKVITPGVGFPNTLPSKPAKPKLPTLL